MAQVAALIRSPAAGGRETADYSGMQREKRSVKWRECDVSASATPMWMTMPIRTRTPKGRVE